MKEDIPNNATDASIRLILIKNINYSHSELKN